MLDNKVIHIRSGKMSESREAVNLDLSEDTLSAGQSSSHEATDRCPVKNTFPQDAGKSVIDALRSIQKENPQVEAIFIDSDEDEDTLDRRPDVKLHNVRTLSSDIVLSHTNVAFSTSTSSSHDFHSSNISHNSKFRVTEISPSMLTPSIVKNANTIALQDESKGSTTRKYLVIPKEVLPILATSKGPISLNVPGIGPLLIPRPSEIIKSAGATIEKNVHISIQDSHEKMVPAEKPFGTSVGNPLCDPKFQCWKYRKGIKRDLDGFSFYDRLGFYKAEQKKSKMCAFRSSRIVEKLQNSINMTKRKLLAIRGSPENKDNIEQVEIDKIKKRRRKHSQRKNNISEIMEPPSLSPYQKKNLSTLISWKKHFDSNEVDDLLLTKKVVILKGAKRGRKKKVEPMGSNEKDDQDSDHNYSPSETFSLEENENIDDQEKPAEFDDSNKKRKRGRPRKYKHIDENKPILPVKRKRGRPRVDKSIDTLTYYKNLYNVKPCCIELLPVEVDPEMLEKYETYYKDNPRHCRVIDSLKQFQGEIDTAKPILVVNNIQCATMNLTELCFTNNIIFPTPDISSISPSFVTSSEALNVLFVKPEILCTYLAGVRD